MKLEFAFLKTKKDLKKHGISYDSSLGDVRGLANEYKGEAFINLSATQWKLYKELMGEDVLIKEIGKTIVHEIIHCEIYDSLLNDYHYNEYVEEIVKIMANQKE